MTTPQDTRNEMVIQGLQARVRELSPNHPDVGTFAFLIEAIKKGYLNLK